MVFSNGWGTENITCMSIVWLMSQVSRSSIHMRAWPATETNTAVCDRIGTGCCDSWLDLFRRK